MDLKYLPWSRHVNRYEDFKGFSDARIEVRMNKKFAFAKKMKEEENPKEYLIAYCIGLQCQLWLEQKKYIHATRHGKDLYAYRDELIKEIYLN